MARHTGKYMGTEIRARREALAVAQSWLAKRLDLHANTLAQWERDERPVGHPAMLRLALDQLQDEARTRLDVERESSET